MNRQITLKISALLGALIVSGLPGSFAMAQQFNPPVGLSAPQQNDVGMVQAKAMSQGIGTLPRGTSPSAPAIVSATPLFTAGLGQVTATEPVIKSCNQIIGSMVNSNQQNAPKEITVVINGSANNICNP